MSVAEGEPFLKYETHKGQMLFLTLEDARRRLPDLSPFGFLMKGTRNEVNYGLSDLPILVVFNDGTVIDMERRIGGSDPASDGTVEFQWSYSSHGVLLDAKEITELRIRDTVIPIN